MANSCKFYKMQRQVSYDGGVSWQNLNEFQKGDLYERNSSSCGYMEVTRWVTTGTTCQGYDKYNVQVKEISYDGGTTWNRTTETQSILAERNSTDCGYVPPTPTGTKLYATYRDGRTYTKNCDGDSTLTRYDATPSGYRVSAMTSAVIGSCVTEIAGPTDGTVNGAFYDCTSLSSVTIPDSVTSIGKYAFSFSYSLTGITIPDSVVTIGINAFVECSGMTSISIGTGVTNISSNAFERCHGLTNLTIPGNVRNIGDSVFFNCSGLTSLIINNGVTSISSHAFGFCPALTSVTIPDSVTSIGQEAFAFDSGLTSVTCLATTPPTLGSGVFDFTNNCPIYVPSGSVNAYKTVTNWSSYATRIQAIQ